MPSGLSSKESKNMLSDINSLNWNSLGMTTEGKRRAFAWGMAMHTAADIFAHSAFVYSASLGKWCHLAHGGNGINNYADNTGKYAGRYFAAANAVEKMITKYDAKSGAGSYKQFSGIGTSTKEYRLLDLVKNIKATTSDSIGTPYSSYDLSNRAILEFYW